MGLMTTQACCLALGVLCTMLLPASCQVCLSVLRLDNQSLLQHVATELRKHLALSYSAIVHIHRVAPLPGTEMRRSPEPSWAFAAQGPSGKPTMVLVHGQDVGGASFAYPQPELGRPDRCEGPA